MFGLLSRLFSGRAKSTEPAQPPVILPGEALFDPYQDLAPIPGQGNDPHEVAFPVMPAPAMDAPPARPPETPQDPHPPGRFSLVHTVNRGGSADHYFHFLLGVLAPLVIHTGGWPGGRRGLVASCGILDPLLLELGLPDIDIIDRARWLAMLRAKTHVVTRLEGFDSPAHYTTEMVAALRDGVPRLLGEAPPPADPRVLVVNRGASPDYYQSEAALSRTSANLRRSVPNMAEIAERLNRAGLPADMAELEHATLRAQVRLFGGRRTLVAQFGAALVNMIWMQPGGRVVEIQPAAGGDHFRVLAALCGHDYVVVPQGGPHAPVPPARVVGAVKG